MFWDVDHAGHGLPHNPFKSCLVPRPIGWITTLKADGRVNLAPFSQFALLGFDPGYVGFSASVHPPDCRPKDSIVNARAQGEFVYNMVTLEMVGAMNASSQIVDGDVSEPEALGLECLPCQRVRTPRLAGAPVAFECRVQQFVELPGLTRESDHTLVIGRVVGVHIDDAALDAEGRLDITRLKPVARLGYADYTWVEHRAELPLLNPDLAARRRYGFFGGR